MSLVNASKGFVKAQIKPASGRLLKQLNEDRFIREHTGFYTILLLDQNLYGALEYFIALYLAGIYEYVYIIRCSNLWNLY